MAGLNLADGDKLCAPMMNNLAVATIGTGTGIGCKVSWSGSGDNCSIDPGVVLTAGELRAVEDHSSLSVGTRNATNPKRNLIIYDYSADDTVVLEGTAAAYPEPPALTDTRDVVLAMVYLDHTGGDTLSAASFTDMRVFIDPMPFAHVHDDFAYDDADLWGTTGSGSSGAVDATVIELDPDVSNSLMYYLVGDGNLMSSSAAYWARVRLKCSLSSLSTATVYAGFFDSTGTAFSTSNNWVALKFTGTSRYASVGSSGTEATTSAGTLDASYHMFDIIRRKDSSGNYGVAVMVDMSDTWYESSTYNGPSTNLRFGVKASAITSYEPLVYIDKATVLYRR